MAGRNARVISTVPHIVTRFQTKNQLNDYTQVTTINRFVRDRLLSTSGGRLSIGRPFSETFCIRVREALLFYNRVCSGWVRDVGRPAGPKRL